MEISGGPHWDPDLIGPRGELMRLHKGAKQQPLPPPAAVPKESDTMEASLQMQEDMRRMRRSHAGSFLGGRDEGRSGATHFLGQ